MDVSDPQAFQPASPEIQDAARHLAESVLGGATQTASGTGLFPDFTRRLREIEAASGETLPTSHTLALAESQIQDEELRRASGLIAHRLDVPPSWFLRPERVGGLRLYKDPITGHALTFETARRVLKPFEAPMIRRMLHPLVHPQAHYESVPGEAAIPVPAQEPVDPERIAQAVRSLAPVDGESLTFAHALGMAVSLARSNIEFEDFSRNLGVASKLTHFSPEQMVGIAEAATANKVTFHAAPDVLAFAYPESAPAIKQGERLLGVQHSRYAGLLPFAGEDAQQGMKVSAEALANQGKYLDAAKALTKQIHLDAKAWENSFLGRNLHAINNMLNTGYHRVVGAVAYGFAPVGQALHFVGLNKSTWNQDLKDANDLWTGKSDIGEIAYRENPELGRWIIPAADFLGRWEFSPDIVVGKLLRFANLPLEAQPTWLAFRRINNFIEGDHFLLGNKTIAQEMDRIITESRTPEAAYNGFVKRFRSLYGVNGIDPRVSEPIFHAVKTVSKAGMSQENRLRIINDVWKAAFGTKPFDGSWASRIVADAVRIRNPELPLDIADKAGQLKQFADEAGLVNDAAVMSVLDDLHYAFGPGKDGTFVRAPVQHDIPRLSLSRDVAQRLKRSPLLDNPVARAIVAPFNRTPGYFWRLEDASIPYSMQVERAMRRARVFSDSEITKEVGTARGIEPQSFFERERAFYGHTQHMNKLMFGKIAHSLGWDPEGARTIALLGSERLSKLNRDLYREVYGADLPKPGVIPEGFTEPILETQLVNELASLDPLEIRKVLAREMGSFRRLRAASYRAIGKAAPEAKAAHLPVYKVARNFADRLEKDLFLKWWKPMAVFRPAYVLRGPGLEQFQTFADIGVMAKLKGYTSIAKHLPDETMPVRVIGMIDRLDPLAQELDRLGFTQEEAISAVLAGEGNSLGLPPKMLEELRKVSRSQVRTVKLRLPRLMFPEDEPLAATGNVRNAFESFGYIRNQEIQDLERTGGYDLLPPSAPQHSEAWFRDLDLQFRQSVAGRELLRHVADEVPYEQRADLMRAFYNTDDGRYVLHRMGNPDVESLIDWQVRTARAYTLDAPDLADAALHDPEILAQSLENVPVDSRPYVHGPRLQVVSGRERSYLQRATNTLSRWIFELPHDRLNRMPFYKVWRDRAFKTMLRHAADSGVPISERFIAEATAESQRFALQQVHRVLIDFSDRTRLSEMMGFLSPFFHPYEQFMTKWAGLIRRNPALVGYARTLENLAHQSGLFRKDPETGEEVVNTTWFLGAGAALRAMSGVPGWQLLSPVAGFNLFFSDVLHIPTGSLAGDVPFPVPSLGPPAAWFVQKLLEPDSFLGKHIPVDNVLPEHFRNNLIAWAFRYGDVGPGSFLPRWLHYAVEGLAGGSFDPNQFNSTQEEFMRLMQFQKVSTEDIMREDHLTRPQAEAKVKAIAQSHTRAFMGVRALFSLFMPSAPSIRFPTADLEDQYQKDTAKYGPLKGKQEFLKAHPDMYLIAQAKTLWAGKSPIPMPANQAVQRLLTLPGFQQFAQDHPRWATLILPKEIRNGKFDFGVWADQLATGQRVQTSPEQFMGRADLQQAWDQYWPIHQAWLATQEDMKHRGVSETSSLWEAEHQHYEQSIELLGKTYPAWGRRYGTSAESLTLTLGLQPGVLGEARRLVKDKLFMQFDVGKGTAQYLKLRDHVYDRLREENISSISNTDARKAGLTKEFNQGVDQIIKDHPDFRDAYRVFFSKDLSKVQTAGESLARQVRNSPDYQQFRQFNLRWASLQTELSQTGDNAQKALLYLRLRGMANKAFDQPDQKNPLLIWWHTRNPGQKQDYEMSLYSRPFVFMSRFDREVVLGERTDPQTETAWQGIGKEYAQIQQLTEQGTPAGSLYAVVDKQIRQEAQRNPVFAEQLAHANTWGYAFEQLSPLTKGETAPEWTAFLDGLHKVQGVVDQYQLHGSADQDPNKLRIYFGLKDQLRTYVDTLRSRFPQFAREWDDIEVSNGSSNFLDDFMPQTYFASGGYPAIVVP